MALKPFQTSLTKDTLYEVAAKGRTDQLAPNIEAKGGTVTLYTSQSEPTGSPLTDDMVEDSQTIDGCYVFQAVPNYILVSGTATSVIVSGLRVEEVV